MSPALVVDHPCDLELLTCAPKGRLPMVHRYSRGSVREATEHTLFPNPKIRNTRLKINGEASGNLTRLARTF